MNFFENYAIVAMKSDNVTFSTLNEIRNFFFGQMLLSEVLRKAIMELCLKYVSGSGQVLIQVDKSG